eukprot:TRINITY_DN59493_c0_g1_i1.p3 TRINITY_DN59493_c0_g1~~TRINITY_DN59493_c0_g1_i1.p3  ORF type:complete len:196 (+),score=60.30 TRINITY_DN59493_c0_g1_i1:585-1172(+)
MITCFLGDSLTLGYGDKTGMGWTGRITTALLEHGLDVTAYNLGVRANTTEKLLERWRPEVERRILPGIDLKLIFSFGVADVANNVPSDASHDNAARILSKAMITAPTLVIGPPPVGEPSKYERIVALSQGFSALCEDLEIPYVPVIDAMRGSSVYTQALEAFDNVHPSADGCAALAEYLLQTNTVRHFFGLESYS